MQSESTSTGRCRQAPPRRKACEDCSKSKRRCDLATPARSRCSKLGLVCHYLVPPQRAIGRASATATAGLETAMNGLPPLDDDILAEALLYTEDLDLPFMDDALNSGSQTFPITPQSSSKVATLSNAVTVDLFNPAGSRLHYTVEIFKSAPSRLVSENSTPWCHALL
jgi:hypothetical protein